MEKGYDFKVDSLTTMLTHKHSSEKEGVKTKRRMVHSPGDSRMSPQLSQVPDSTENILKRISITRLFGICFYSYRTL